MTASANQTTARRRLLLASDRIDQSRELAGILERVGEVETIAATDLPETPSEEFSGVVVDINLRSAESVQRVRNMVLGMEHLGSARELTDAMRANARPAGDA